MQKEKARVARERIGSLVIRLGDILRADYARSEAALAQPALQASFGAAHRGMFDFSAMSRLLAHSPPRGGLGERRKRRVEESLAVLRAQRFFPPAGEARGIRRVRVRVRERRRTRWTRSASACPSLRGC